MTLNDVLLSLLDSVGRNGDVYVVNRDTMQQWPVDALDRLLEAGVLVATANAQSIECHGCEHRCFMDVQQLPGIQNQPSRSFVVCDHPDMRDQMGRVPVPPERLEQWKTTAGQLANVIAQLLATENKVEDRHGQASIRIGMVAGKNGRRWLSLNRSPLALESYERCLPLEEVLFFKDDKLCIDKASVDSLVNLATGNRGKKYKPSTAKRDTRKQQTEAMYQDWNDEYQRLRRKYPDSTCYSDTWIAGRIKKMKIAQGRRIETIRKNMKR